MRVGIKFVFLFSDTATTEINTTDTLFPYTTLFRSRPLPGRLRRPRGPETGSWPSSAHGRRGDAARSRADKRRDCSRRWPIVMLPAWRRPPAPCRPDRPRAISAVGERSAASVLPHDIRQRTGEIGRAHV